MPRQRHPDLSEADAIFIGWQKTSWGEVFALYNITVAGHPAYGSTVTHRELRKLHLRIPESTPPSTQYHPQRMGD